MIGTIPRDRPSPKAAPIASPPPPPRSPKPPDRWPFHAREDELEQVLRVLGVAPRRTSADEHRARGVVLAGPTGVGKTRLLRELLAVLEQQGRRIHLSVATRSAAEIPYGAFAGLLPEGSHADHRDPASWHAAVAAGLAAEQGTDGPVVLAIDDAHLLDAGSAALLLHLRVSGAATVLVTLRHGEPAPDAITALWRDGLAHRIDLQPFSRAETESFVDALLQGPVGSRTRRRLAAVSGGNVLYAGELVRGAVESGALRQVDGVWTWDGAIVLAPRLVDAVRQRLGALGQAEREALALIALGEPLPLRLAERVLEPAVVHRLETSALITVAGPEEIPGLRVAHPLYGEVVLAEVGTLQGRRLRRLLVEDLEAAGAARSGPDTVRLASWRIALGDPVPAELLQDAAGRANELFDHPLAERLARAALRADPESAVAGVELAAALNGQNRYAAAEEVLDTIETAVLHHGSSRLQQDYLGTRHTALLLGLGRAEDTRLMLDRAAAALPAARIGEIGPTEALVAVYSASISLSMGRLAETLRIVEPVLAAAPDRVPPLARLLALEQAGEAWAYRAEFARSREIHQQMRAMAATGPAEVQRGLPNALMQEVLCLVGEGAAGPALEQSVVLHEQLGGLPNPTVTSLVTMGLGACQLRCGLAVSACTTLIEAIQAYEVSDHAGQLSWALALLAQAQALSGDPAAAGASLARAEDTQLPRLPARQEVDLVAARALVHWANGRTSEAMAVARRGMPDFPEITIYRARLLHLAARLGAPPRGLLPELSTLAPPGTTGLPPLVLDHVRALDAGHGAELEAVADRFADLGAHLLAAEAATHAAGAYRRAGSAAAAERSAARSQVLLSRCEVVASPALEDVPALNPLSPREAEVARLAARGLSNAAIAEELVLSVRTVESHLYQVFGKLGVTHRTELAGLLQPTRTPEIQ